MKNLLWFTIFIWIISCKTNMGNANTEKAKIERVKMENSASHLIAKGNLYGSGAEGIVKQNSIITNHSDWNKLLSQMNSVNKVSDSFLETTYDFSKYTIIAVFDEVKGSGGHRLELMITSYPEKTLVNISYLAPSGVSSSVMTQPYHILKIPKNKLPIVFK